MRRFSLVLTAASLLVLPLVTGCGSEDGGAVTETPREVDTGAGGDDSGGTTTATTVGAGGADPGPEVCPAATGVYEAEAARSNVLFLLDRSGSMHLRISEDSTRWTATKAGLFDLIDALPAQTNAGMIMFPRGDAPVTCCAITADNVIDCSACGPYELPGPDARCDATWYTTPPVEVGELDGARRDAIKTFVSTADEQFFWGTPLAPALQGAIDYQVKLGAPGVSSVVLLTDGNPTSCDTDADPAANEIQRVVDAAASGLGAASSVRTFVLGVIDGDAGANAANLSKVALAGGTARYPGCEDAGDCAYPVNVANFAADMQEALDAIALQAFDCTFQIPEVEGGSPDFDAVNITLTANGQTQTLPKDTTHAAGWDYLPGNAQVQLYGEACTALKSDESAKVEVVVGCKTVGQ